MTYEPYEPNDKQITPKTHAVAWFLCLVLIGVVAVSGTLSGENKTDHRLVVEHHQDEMCE